MKVKDFFRLALKLIAIFYAVQVIYSIAGSFQFFISSIPYSLFYAILGFIAVLIPAFVYYLIFVKSDKVMNILKIDKGFESEEVNFGNLSSKEILKIAFIIFGLLMIVQNIPSFVTNCFYAFKHSAKPTFYEFGADTAQHDYFAMTESGIYILLGYLMLTNYKRISGWFDK